MESKSKPKTNKFEMLKSLFDPNLFTTSPH